MRAGRNRAGARAATSWSAGTRRVLALDVEALIERILADADLRDPDLPDQHLSCAPCAPELHRIRDLALTVGDHTINVITRRELLQQRILAALHVDTNGWHRPTGR